MKRFLISLSNFYSNYISKLIYPRCIYIPSCSQYFRDCLEEYGVFFGCWKTFGRILRCNPFFKGGYDPVRRKDQCCK